MDGRLKIHCGDCRDILPTLEAGSVQCCVTSPPYWRLRDYGTAQWEGGEETCDHLMPEEYIANMVAVFREVKRVLRDDGTCWINLGSSYASGDKLPNRSHSDVPACGTDGRELLNSQSPDLSCLDLCDGCRAAIESHRLSNADNDLSMRQSLPLFDGTSRDSVPDLEFSPNALSFGQRSTMNGSFQQPPTGCFHCANCGACLSVLRSSSRDASLCARRSAYIGGIAQTEQLSGVRTSGREPSSLASLYSAIRDYKSKDLVNMPFWLAEALRLDGWYLRSEIVWHKPNPMPESCRDRPTKSHEMIYLLTKQARYYYDAEAIAEPADNGFRNKRSVWTIPTQPYAEAHFATFPEEIPKLCILAGCPQKVCADCGAPVYSDDDNRNQDMPRVPTGVPNNIEAQQEYFLFENLREQSPIQNTKDGEGLCADSQRIYSPLHTESSNGNENGLCFGTQSDHGEETRETAFSDGGRESHQWNKGRQSTTEPGGDEQERPRLGIKSGQNQNGSMSLMQSPIRTEGTCRQCGCDRFEPGVVLDCFAGSGTVGKVALELGRKAILIELNPEYVRLIKVYTAVTVGWF